jgi:hypothetical protein
MKIITIFALLIAVIFVSSKTNLKNKEKIKSAHKSKLSKTEGKNHHKLQSKLKSKNKKCPGGSAAPKAPWQNVPYPDINTYAYVNNDPYLLQNQAGFKNAKIWPGTLPTHLNSFPYTGVYGAAETGVHNKFYYDGSLRLGKVAQVNCDFYTTEPRGCVNQKGCGWCGENNKCIAASPLGPIAPCVRSTFIYTMPSAEWNPLKAPAINILALDNNGNSLLGVTHEPNLKDAPVAKPYRLD